MSDMRSIILASASPRRRELLALTGLKFRVVASDYEEDLSTPCRPHDLARRLSLEKAMTVASMHDNALIIAADTFLVFGKRLLGKPRSEKEALRMLSLLNGKSHAVITGYTVLDTATGRKVSRSVETKVWFRKMTRNELSAYVKTGEPLDKAGAYAIQGLGSLIVKKIEGDYFNVVGLPLASLADTLKTFRIHLL